MDVVNETIQSRLCTINTIIEEPTFYNVPLYQRLYVWNQEQIKKLLEDLPDAYKAKKTLFFLGGVLLVKTDPAKDIYDLIDGQQRFTTLWLLGLELGEALQGLTKVGEELRLKFSIREEATLYFNSALDEKEEGNIAFQDLEDGSLSRIVKARRDIKNFISHDLEKEKISKAEFASFIRQRVNLIVSEVAPDTDLNKLFEVVNNRGVQLQHHEILKALLLSNIQNNQERIRYGKVWNACSDMENYIERSLRAEIGQPVFKCYDKWSRKFSFKSIIDLMKEQKQKEIKPIDLNTILSKNFDEEGGRSESEFEMHPEATDDEVEEVRSILTFPQLLLHTLRIYLFKQKQKDESAKGDIHKISEKELLYTFEEYFDLENEREAKKFIELLWEVRVRFDAFIIKWVKVDGKDEVHLIKKLEKNNQYRKQTYYLQRKKNEGYDGFALLQSMLYHSQQITTHYWLTPLPDHAIEVNDPAVLFKYLRKLDNLLFCSKDEDDLIKRTWKYIGQDVSIIQRNYEYSFFEENLGVKFWHYWFYKLEFVLRDSFDEGQVEPEYKSAWKSFRLTAKNSVEHISPQLPKEFEEFKVSKEYMNTFGNLSLVSRSINSEYSNNIFRVKRENFRAKNREELDSLKMYLIYKNEYWDNAQCMSHNEQMKEVFARYLNQN